MPLSRRAAKTAACPPETGHVTIGQTELVYLVQRSPQRRRTISFTVEAGPHIRVLVPVRTGRAEIETLLRQRASWITRQLTHRETRTTPTRAFSRGEALSYLGESLILDVTRDTLRPQGCVVAEGVMRVNISGDFTCPVRLRQETRFEIARWYKKQALCLFQELMQIWSAKLRVTPGRLILTDTSGRWGSCNARNDIRLCWRLIMAPREIVAYVVAHELCHIPHKNHGRRFWALLGSVMPDYLARRQALRKMAPQMAL